MAVGGDFRKPWQRDEHLLKLDVRLLPALKRKQWRIEEFIEFCQVEVGGGCLGADLLERWLVSADERGLAEQISVGEGEGGVCWAITDHGRSQGRLLSRVLARLQKLSAIIGVASLSVAIAGDQFLSPSFRPIALLVFLFGTAILVGFVFGGTAAEQSGALLRKVAGREAEVQSELSLESSQPMHADATPKEGLEPPTRGL